MTLFEWIWAVFAGATSGVWIVACVRGIIHAGRLPRLPDMTGDSPREWPRLSVIIPACNEGATIGAALTTLLAQDYPNLEFVVIDDRSTDNTGAIIDEFARADPRVSAIHISELPRGWLGKVHALDVGARAASGQWLLFSDADVHFARGALQKAVAHAAAHELDHVALLPEVRSGTFWQEVALDAFGGLFLTQTRAWLVADPKSDAFMGVGAFNLVRRTAFERTAGFEWLRMEIADDMGLGLLLKRSGARAAVYLAPLDLNVLWYGSLPAMFAGLEKNVFGVMAHFSYPRMLVRLLGFSALVLGPLSALFLTAVPYAWLATALAYLSIVPGALVLRRAGVVQRVAPTLLLPVGMVLIGAMAVRSTLYCLRRKGIVWRGTHYPIAELRAQQRVRL